MPDVALMFDSNYFQNSENKLCPDLRKYGVTLSFQELLDDLSFTFAKPLERLQDSNAS